RGSSPHPVLPHGPLLLSDEALVTSHPPSRVLVVGRHTLHREIAALARTEGIVVEQVSVTAQWSDPSHVVSRVWTWQEFTTMPPDDAARRSDPEWAQAWAAAGRALAERVTRELRHAPDLAGVRVAALVLSTLSSTDTLLLGSSNTPRDLNLAEASDADRPVVLGNRGLAGIDGTNACAVGLALASSGGSVVALMGDLTFQHDINGLLIGPDEPRPNLTIVVVNDQGGGIFGTLEYGHPDRCEDFARIFATPTDADLAGLCSGMGVSHQKVTSLGELQAAMAEEADGIRVIEVPVHPTDDAAARDGLRAAAHQAPAPLD
ncbi:MAG: thiamine pyrophosphate-dependent enzyme, partial [Ornithinimicrobium sp.]